MSLPKSSPTTFTTRARITLCRGKTHPCLMAPLQPCPFASCSSSTKQTQRYCCNRHVPFSLFIPDVFPCRFSEIQLTVHKSVPKEERLHINHRSCWAVKCRFMLARKKASNRLQHHKNQRSSLLQQLRITGAKPFPKSPKFRNKGTGNIPSSGRRPAQLPSPPHQHGFYSPDRAWHKTQQFTKAKGRIKHFS